jgi:hypothetical protein
VLVLAVMVHRRKYAQMGHGPRSPPVLHPFDQGDVLVGAWGMRLPRRCKHGQVDRVFIRQHRRLQRPKHIDVVLLFEPRDRCAIKQATVCH